MYKHIHIISTVLFLTIASYAQEKDSIGTQIVNIVKPYTPTLSDAFKILENPVLNDTLSPESPPIAYSIFSVPVASTFVPTTGNALKRALVDKETLYNTYLSLALGNYNTALLDFYTARPLDKNTALNIGLHHHSSQGGISNIALDDNFFNTGLQLAYAKKRRSSDWKAEAGFQHQRYNWYGIYDINAFDQNTINSLEERQNYYDVYVSAAITQRDSYFKEGAITLRRFWDAFNSAEYRMVANPSLAFPIAGERITTKINLDYLYGDFNRAYLDTSPIHYSSLLAGINPSLVILRDDIKVTLGARMVYAFSPDTNTSDFFIYPHIDASYNIIKNHLTTYGGIKGDLIQNTYRDFVAENQFLSPTLTITPTDKQYDAYLGFKGKFSGNLGYHIKGTYSVENDKPLFLLNPVTNMPDEAYGYGNSFGIRYDDVKTFSFLGALDIDVYKNLNIDIRAEFFDYQTENEPEAWNLPAVKGTVAANYSIGKHWFGSTNIFYVGGRSDLLDVEGFIDPEIITADSYVDINTQMEYRFNNRLSAFVKLNNILNNEYARWATYPVQGFQALAGVSYQFNF